MPKIVYDDHSKISADKMALIERACAIIDEYEAQGYDLTLRQLYYQFVAKGLIANSLREYNRLGGAIDTGRMCGIIDWNSIVDRTRGSKQNSHWGSPADILKDASEAYNIDMWQDQDHRVEVWIEKEALAGVVEGVCRKWDIPFLACRGYVSQSEMWRSSQRIVKGLQNKQHTIIIHLGDHDPSGIDMTRDITERLSLFVGHHFKYANDGKPYQVQVHRIALNMDQIEEHNPPPNPAKMTDSRCEAYVQQFGESSWELDALEPSVLNQLIEDNIFEFLNMRKWDKKVKEVKKQRNEIKKLADAYRLEHEKCKTERKSKKSKK